MRISYWSSDVCSSDLGALSVQASSFHSPRVAPGRGRSAYFDRLPGEDATRLVQDPALLADACLSGSFRAGHPRGRSACVGNLLQRARAPEQGARFGDQRMRVAVDELADAQRFAELRLRASAVAHFQQQRSEEHTYDLQSL